MKLENLIFYIIIFVFGMALGHVQANKWDERRAAHNHHLGVTN